MGPYTKLSEMKLFIVAVMTAALVGAAVGELTDDCLACMCYVSSYGCKLNDPPCQDNGFGEVCGPWAITKLYWVDGGLQGGEFYGCVSSWDCNEATVRSYLDRYVTSPYADCEYYARTHVGGPSGASQAWTMDYWNK